MPRPCRWPANRSFEEGIRVWSEQTDRLWDEAEARVVTTDPGAYTNVVNTRLTTDYTRLYRRVGTPEQLSAARQRLKAALATGRIRLGESDDWNNQNLKAVGW